MGDEIAKSLLQIELRQAFCVPGGTAIGIYM